MLYDKLIQKFTRSFKSSFLQEWGVTVEKQVLVAQFFGSWPVCACWEYICDCPADLYSQSSEGNVCPKNNGLNPVHGFSDTR